jgi:phosphatidylglycerol:prolipoprotein diacylglycerol transferase
VHPTQLYASLAAALTYAFMYSYWPYRKYDGQILSLTIVMAGTTRFFEEILRADEAAFMPSVSTSMTVAQWVAIGIVLLGFGMMYLFRRRGVLYVPPQLPPPPAAGALPAGPAPQNAPAK